MDKKVKTGIRFYRAGDRAILAVLGDEIREDINDRVGDLYQALRAERDPALVEAVPSYAAVLVHYRPEMRSYEAMCSYLTDLSGRVGGQRERAPRTVVIPVCYGLHFGPDLWEMEEKLAMSREEIIRLHTERDYRIYMMGFLPGFVYLGGLDERLFYPRLAKPRMRIEAGAVGIAGQQTGVYPFVSPGGWRIIGNTPLNMYDPDNPELAGLGPGDRIRFQPISVDEWYELKRKVARQGNASGERSHADVSPAADGAGSPQAKAFGLKVLQPGALTTVQDGGRCGGQAQGMTESGAMDRRSYARANRLLGNDPHAAVLELTLVGGAYEVLGDGWIALTGGDLQACLNDAPLPMDQAAPVKAGDRLRFGMARKGLRAYLALTGGIDVPEVAGSRATNLKVGIGGLAGRKLRTGDVLWAGETAGSRTALVEVASTSAGATAALQDQEVPVLQELERRTDADGVTAIRFLYGPQDDRFPETLKERFTESVYTISEASDRMGYRLEGPTLLPEGGTDILSDGICFGSIQVPSDGKPIVLMADHQTTGGYAKIATVISPDLPLLAQMGPGAKIRFTPAGEGLPEEQAAPAGGVQEDEA